MAFNNSIFLIYLILPPAGLPFGFPGMLRVPPFFFFFLAGAGFFPRAPVRVVWRFLATVFLRTGFAARDGFSLLPATVSGSV